MNIEMLPSQAWQIAYERICEWEASLKESLTDGYHALCVQPLTAQNEACRAIEHAERLTKLKDPYFIVMDLFDPMAVREEEQKQKENKERAMLKWADVVLLEKEIERKTRP